jgi:uncharacterized protein YndB with AHSA1/START domain
MMKPLHCKGSTYIDQPVAEVFEFLANPKINPEELTPLEDEVTERDQMPGIGTETHMTVEFAARELKYVARCTEYKPPHRLVSQLEGDMMEGTEAWDLASQRDGTRAYLTLELIRPEWTPAYLRDDITADRWGQMLVDQTLANVKSAVERPADKKSFKKEI